MISFIINISIFHVGQLDMDLDLSPCWQINLCTPFGHIFTAQTPRMSHMAAVLWPGCQGFIAYSFLHVQLAFMTHFYLPVPSKKIQNSFLFFLHRCIWIWVLVGVLIHLCILNEWVYIIDGASCYYSGCQKPFVNSFLGCIDPYSFWLGKFGWEWAGSLTWSWYIFW